MAGLLLRSFWLFLPFGILSASLTCCSSDGPVLAPQNKLPKDNGFRTAVAYSKGYADFEAEEIRSYIDSLGLPLRLAPSGVYANVISGGRGAHPSSGDKVCIRYSLAPLGGDTCPSFKQRVRTAALGTQEILAPGIEDAVRLLSAGGEGEFIIPAYRAFGSAGHGQCVPPITPVFCHIWLLSVEKAASDAAK